MTSLNNYSKFDHMDEDDSTSSDEQLQAEEPQPISQPQAQLQPQPLMTQTKKGSEEGRYVFEYQGRKIYEWDQNLDGEFWHMMDV